MAVLRFWESAQVVWTLFDQVADTGGIMKLYQHLARAGGVLLPESECARGTVAGFRTLKSKLRRRCSILAAILVAFTQFSTLNPQPASAQAPLPDGFNPGANADVYSLAVQADGKILVGGWFSTLGGQTRNCVGRLNADGTLDSGFNPGANQRVNSLAVQADGKILVAGWFTTLGGQTRNYIGRVNANGILDSGFNARAGNLVESLAVQADGKILLGGWLNTLGGQTRIGIGRLNPDGTVDSGFNPGANNDV